ncbi:helix-turn-helix domain-containing protein [Priestia megaterium]|uniref:helix-turn-helix domain-containing protein n=1 Tax=Priestia megaterium TaxID=1404 RepID=UPI003CFCBA07
MAKGKYEKWITEEGLVLLEGWARDGLTDEQIAHNAGVSRSTLNDWKKRYPDILDALKKGKEVVDLQVENALLKRALGYEYEEITKESQWNEKTNKYELVITKSVKKRQAPDTTAQIFWLKNRRPDKWRDKQDVEHSGNVTNQNIDMSALGLEELRKLAKLDE